MGCRTVIDAETGQSTTQVDPENSVVAAIDTGVAIATPVAEAAKPLVPQPWQTVIDLFLLGVVGWQKVKEMKIVKGSKAAATVIKEFVKTDAADWAAASKTMDEAANTGLIKAINPDQL